MEHGTSIPSYKEGYAELRGNLTKMVPAQLLSDFDGYAEELQKSLSGILKVKKGEKAHNFALNNQLGQSVALYDLLRKGQVVLVFYRGAWCPYCNLQLAQLESALSEMKSLNAILVAISPQSPDVSLTQVEKNKITFDVLSDVGNVVARKFTTVFTHSDKANEILKQLGIDFESFYGDDSNEIPVPAVFVIGVDGIVKFAKSEGADYRNRVETSEILEALK